MKRCPACGTAFIYGGEFCSMDGTRLISVPVTPLVGVGDQHAEPRPPNETLVSGSLPQPEARPTGAVDDASPTGAIAPTGVTIALGLGDSALVGAVLADRYRLEGLIGRGGMGVVYRARHLLLDRPVAVKLLRAHYLEDERSVQRFMREAQAMARVEHRNAVTIHDFGMMPDGGAYLVMEFIEGETLRAMLNRAGPLAPADAVAIAEQICGAVDAAHRQGVVHRDLKPENIMFKRVDDENIVKVVDFGLAKLTDPESVAGKPQLTSAGDLFGTPAYMAPEYFEGEEVGPRADVYSIGIIVYEMLAGNPPFQGSVQTIMSGHLFKEPPPVRDSRPLTPPGLERSVRTALRKRAAQRYGSAADFAARLVAGLAGDDFDRESPPTGIITTRIPATSVPKETRADIAEDEAPTFVGFSPDEIETIGGPGRIPTRGLPDHATDAGPADGPPTVPVEAPSLIKAVRRRIGVPAAAAATVLGAALVGGLVFATANHADPPSAEEVLPQAGPSARALPEVAPVPADAPADEAPVAAAPDGSEAARDATTAPRSPAPPPPDRPTVSKMEVAPSRSDRTATDGDRDDGSSAVASAPTTDQRRGDAKSSDKKPAETAAKADKDKGKKKQRRWYNPLSW
jgi:serine/threonine-protein kinase